MAHKVIMPKLGVSMVEGTIGRWLFNEGDSIHRGDILLTIETDKAEIEVDSQYEGILAKIIKGDGEIVPVAGIVGIIANTDEDISALLEDNLEPPSVKKTPQVNGSSSPYTKLNSKRVLAVPKARALAKKEGIDLSHIMGSGQDGIIREQDVLLAIEKGKIKASSLAKAIAEQRDIALSSIQGTGINNKIMKKDVLQNNKQDMNKKDKVLPLTNMRKIIASNMTKSLHNMAQANHTMHLDMSEIIRMRSALVNKGRNISYNAILIKIVAQALKEFPNMNTEWTEEGILFKNDINIGIAVALTSGLVVPVVRNADQKSLLVISEEVSNLVQKAKEGHIVSDEYNMGTFTISNLGMYDLDHFTAIINPPQVGILAIGKITETPAVENDGIVIKPIMKICLTYDHRVIDGAPAAEFLQRIQQFTMVPYMLI